MKKPNSSATETRPSYPLGDAQAPVPATILICSKHPVAGVATSLPARDLLAGATPPMLSPSAVLRPDPLVFVDVMPLVALAKGVPRLLNQKALLLALRRGGKKSWPKVSPHQRVSVVQIDGPLDAIYLDALEYSLDARVTTKKPGQEIMIDRLAADEVLLENVREVCGISRGKHEPLDAHDIGRIFLLKDGTAHNRVNALAESPECQNHKSVDQTAKADQEAEFDQVGGEVESYIAGSTEGRGSGADGGHVEEAGQVWQRHQPVHPNGWSSQAGNGVASWGWGQGEWGLPDKSSSAKSLLTKLLEATESMTEKEVGNIGLSHGFLFQLQRWGEGDKGVWSSQKLWAEIEGNISQKFLSQLMSDAATKRGDQNGK